MHFARPRRVEAVDEMGEVSSFEVIIVGGGPAGLSAALVLGRCLRRVCVIDAGTPRNARARAAHGFYTRDGADPAELRRIAREQLGRYDVHLHDDEAVAVERNAGRYRVITRKGQSFCAPKLLLATGMRDRLPERPGFRELFGGGGVYVCPYCDGWEVQGRRLAAYASPTKGPEFALGLLTWSDDVILVTPEAVADDERETLERNGLGLRTGEVASLEGGGGRLAALVFASGERLARDALFVHCGEEQAAPFAVELGCELSSNRTVRAHDGERTGVPGLFVAGDTSHDLQLIAIAVAEGVRAACAINTELRREGQR